MKKWRMALLAVLFMLTVGISTRAAEPGREDSNRSTKEGDGAEAIDVYARFIRTSDVYEKPVENDSASVELKDGTVIEAGLEGSQESQPTDGLRLVVYPITRADDEAWQWIERCMVKYGTELYPLDIYFEDQEGNRVELEGYTLTITVTTLESYKKPVVCYVAENGTATMLECTANGSQLTFRTTHNSYYVLAEGAEAGGEEDTEGDTERQTETERDTERQTESERDTERQTETERNTERQTETERDTERQTESERDTERQTEANSEISGGQTGSGKGTTGNTGSSAKTGDDTHIWLWLLAAVMSAGLISGSLLYRKSLGRMIEKTKTAS